MDGDILRPHGQHALQTAAKALEAVPGQPGDQVHVHAVEAHLTGQGKGRLNIPRPVAAANGLEHLILQGLGVDGDASDLVAGEDRQLFPGDGVRAARLYRIFDAVAQG